MRVHIIGKSRKGLLGLLYSGKIFFWSYGGYGASQMCINNWICSNVRFVQGVDQICHASTQASHSQVLPNDFYLHMRTVIHIKPQERF